MFVEYVIVQSFASWRAAVNRAVGAEVLVPRTGLISRRLSPNNLLLAREIGALISASVSKLAAVPRPDCAKTDAFVSVDASVPVRINDTTSACGNAGSAATLVVGCDNGPSIIAVTR